VRIDDHSARRSLVAFWPTVKWIIYVAAREITVYPVTRDVMPSGAPQLDSSLVYARQARGGHSEQGSWKLQSDEEQTTEKQAEIAWHA